MEIYTQMFDVYVIAVSVYKCVDGGGGYTRVWVSFVKGGKDLHHCLFWADMKESVSGNRATEART